VPEISFSIGESSERQGIGKKYSLGPGGRVQGAARRKEATGKRTRRQTKENRWLLCNGTGETSPAAARGAPKGDDRVAREKPRRDITGPKNFAKVFPTARRGNSGKEKRKVRRLLDSRSYFRNLPIGLKKGKYQKKRSRNVRGSRLPVVRNQKQMGAGRGILPNSRGTDQKQRYAVFLLRIKGGNARKEREGPSLTTRGRERVESLSSRNRESACPQNG